MPSNKDLTASILEIDKDFNLEGKNNAEMNAILKELRLKKSILELDENADLEGKNFEELTAMFEELKPKSTTTDDPQAAPKEAAEAKEAATKARQEKEIEEAEKKAKSLPPYRVADGKSITCLKGILADGDEVKAKYLPEGDKTLQSLVKRGFVIKK